MGQVAGSPEGRQCGPYSERAHTQARINLLSEFLSEKDSVVDRSNLSSVYPSSLSDFVTPPREDASCPADVEIASDGNVTLVKIAPSMGSKVMKCVFPTPRIFCDGDQARFRMLCLADDGGGHESSVKVFKRGMPKDLHSSLAKTVETLTKPFHLDVARELIRVDYDKVEVIEEVESLRHSDMHDWPSCRVIVGFNWVVLKKFTFNPLPDMVMDLCNSLLYSTDSKDKIDNRVERNPRLTTKDKNRYYEHVGRGPAIDIDLFLQTKAKYAPERKYVVEANPAGEESLYKGTLEECLDLLFAEMKTSSVHRENWHLLLGWEPQKIVTLDEYFHHAAQQRNRGNDNAALDTCMQCCDYLNHKYQAYKHVEQDLVQTTNRSKKSTSTKLPPLPQLSEEQVSAIFSSGRTLIDRAVGQYMDGQLSQDRFEDQFLRVSLRMVDFVDCVLLPSACKLNVAAFKLALLRTKADYLRQVVVWVPRARDREEEIKQIYNQALGMRHSLPSWSQATISTYINFAVYCAEVMRDNETAVHLCAAGKEHVERSLHRGGADNAPTPSAIFNWSLLESNRRAYCSWLVILQITFDPRSLESHAACHKPPDVVKEEVVQSKSGWRECGGMYATYCAPSEKDASETVGAPDHAMKFAKEQEPEHHQSTKAALQWLKTKPFHNHPFKYMEAARWIDAIEVFDATHFIDPEWVEDEETGQEAAHKPTIESKRQAIQQAEALEGNTFLAACVLQPKRLRDIQSEKERKELAARNDPGRGMVSDSDMLHPVSDGLSVEHPRPEGHDFSFDLIREFELAFPEWPTEHSRTAADEFHVHIRSMEDLNVVNQALDDDGLIVPLKDAGEPSCRKCGYVFAEVLPWCPECKTQRQASAWKISGLAVHPGSTLVQIGPKAVKLSFIRNAAEPFKQRLTFVPPLRVASAKVLHKGSYSCFHELFRGWKEHGNLRFLPTPWIPDLHDLGRGVREWQTEMREPRPPPRRIQGLSARRDPLEAAQRGCR